MAPAGEVSSSGWGFSGLEIAVSQRKVEGALIFPGLSLTLDGVLAGSLLPQPLTVPIKTIPCCLDYASLTLIVTLPCPWAWPLAPLLGSASGCTRCVFTGPSPPWAWGPRPRFPGNRACGPTRTVPSHPS